MCECFITIDDTSIFTLTRCCFIKLNKNIKQEDLKISSILIHIIRRKKQIFIISNNRIELKDIQNTLHQWCDLMHGF